MNQNDVEGSRDEEQPNSFLRCQPSSGHDRQVRWGK